jgi:antirestriction protein ArdC
MSQFDLYAEITKQITEMLEKGVVPWRSPIMGRGTAGHPSNLDSGKHYRGVNVFLLAFAAYAKGYESSYWATYKQIQEKGGQVRKGEKSAMVVFWKKYETKDRQTQEPITVPILRYFNVFNAMQADGIEIPDKVAFTPIDFQPVEAAEAIAKGYVGAPAIEHGGTRAYYKPATDTVHMPEQTRFTSAEEYYSTAFHELGHSTGHVTRLARGLDTDPKPFGSTDYGKEELIAEMAAAFLCGHAGIHPPLIENQAAYIQGWIKTIKGDTKLIIAAASAGQKAADWILGERG